jgi:hypothetical protein
VGVGHKVCVWVWVWVLRVGAKCGCGFRCGRHALVDVLINACDSANTTKHTHTQTHTRL